MTEPPPLTGVLETVLYYADQDRAETFYAEVLGMRLISKETGRSLFFRAGSSVFLLFNAEETKKGRTLPAHGSGPGGHTCLLVEAETYENWKQYLSDKGVAIKREVPWPTGAQSFYFYDSEGNLIEIADADFWPR